MMKKTTMLSRWIAAAAAFAILFCAAACSGENKKDEPEQTVNKDESGVYFDNGETFCRGVWAADDGETLSGYYIFTDAGSGRFDEVQFGMGVPFQVTVRKSDVEFNLGAADFSDPATVEITGEGKRTVTWTNDNRVEYLTLLGEYEPDSFRFYSIDVLGARAERYYTNAAGTKPENFSVIVRADGTAVIEFSKGSGKKSKTVAVYEVNCITGKGIIQDTDEEVNLSGIEAGE